MDDLIINETVSTPKIEFRSLGLLTIRGKSLPEDPKRFFNPLLQWVKDLNAEKVDLELFLEYVNTSSSKNLLELIKSIDKNPKIKHLNFYWHYDIDDLGMLEFGELIASNLRKAKAKYIALDENENPIL